MLASPNTLFDIKHFTIYPFIALITIFSLFGTYTLVINKMINHNQTTRGLTLMYSHFFLLISLGIITSAWNLVGQETNKTFLTLFYILGYIGFYLTLFVNEIYLEKENRLNKKEYLKISATLMISFAFMIIFKENFFIVELLLLLFSLSILWIVYKKYGEIRI